MGTPAKCVNCGAGRSREVCHIITLTAEERAVLRDSGAKPEVEYVYCKPCWRRLSDPKTGPSIMKGLLQIQLRQFGVEDAERIATRYHDRLVDRIKPST